MKYALLTLAVLLLAAGAAGLASYRASSNPALQEAQRDGDSLAWVRAEFKLDDAQFQKIQALHAGYARTCAEHCSAVQNAMETLAAVPASGRGTAAEQRRAAESRLQELEARCERSMTDHVHRVAACMAPAEGARYLQMVEPRIAHYEHQGAPDLSLHHHH
jgi:hypothetical protein